jgi:uncharacterized Tic20 family protein
MTSPYIIQALDIYAQTFQRHLEPICIEWVPKAQKFNYNFDPKSIGFWKFNIVVITFFLFFFCCVVLLTREIFLIEKSIPLFNVIALIIILLFSTFAFGVYKIFMLTSIDCTQGWNELKKLEIKIRKGKDC